MKKMIAILAVTLAIPTMSFAEGEGRYQMVIANGASNTFFILDTKTGAVSMCHPRLMDGKKIRCYDKLATAFKSN
ncbi:MAG: hypothetical protein ISQ88_00010 [Rhodobacteraceae bacterium]|nr:hypothetical protein [Paracoccaceae bacterium]